MNRTENITTKLCLSQEGKVNLILENPLFLFTDKNRKKQIILTNTVQAFNVIQCLFGIKLPNNLRITDT